MADTHTPSPQVRVDALTAACQAVVDTLKTMDLSAAEWSEVFSGHLSAECLQCGIQITGNELGQLALVVPEGPAEDPRLGRLRQGYCARKDCSSYYYRLRFVEHPKVDWEKVSAMVTGVGSPAAPTPTPRKKADAFWFLQEPRLRRVAVGIGILLALLVIRHFTAGGRIPLLHQSPKYVVDPASVSEVPSDRPVRPASTNR